MRASAAPSNSSKGKNASSKVSSAKTASSSNGTVAVYDKSTGYTSIPRDNNKNSNSTNSTKESAPPRRSTRNSPVTSKYGFEMESTTIEMEIEDLDLEKTSDDEKSVAPDVDDDFILWQLANPKWVRSEAEEIEMQILGNGREYLQFIVYDDVNKKWTTDLGKRLKKVELPRNFAVTPADYPQFVKLYTVGTDNYYRNDSDKFPVPNVEGVFVLCGCARQQCKTNVACVGHFCGYCATPIHPFCLLEPGSFGCCRKCFLGRVLKEEDKHLVKTKTPVRRRPINIGRPAVAVAPTPAELGSEFVDEDFNIEDEEALAADMSGK
jgi:hypothetical protein